MFAIHVFLEKTLHLRILFRKRITLILLKKGGKVFFITAKRGMFSSLSTSHAPRVLGARNILDPPRSSARGQGA